MTSFYLIEEDTRIQRIVKPRLERAADFKALPAVAAVQVENSLPTDYPDWIEKPERVVSDQLKSVFESLNFQIRFKRIDLVDHARKSHKIYWRMQIPAIDCLSDKSEFHLNQTIKRLVLDPDKVSGKHLFMCKGLLEPYVVISLEGAESLLRRSLTGFKLQKLEWV